jgi:hypothetical protein
MFIFPLYGGKIEVSRGIRGYYHDRLVSRVYDREYTNVLDDAIFLTVEDNFREGHY